MAKKIAVIYHANCPDGFGSAWSAWKKFKDKAEYFATLPRQMPRKTFEGKEIYVLDNSLSVKTQKEIRKNNTLVIIDHHESAKDETTAFPENVFSENLHSGCVLSWKYFHPGVPVPQILKYVEDIDLWKFSLPLSNDIASHIFGSKFDFKLWNMHERNLETAMGRKQYAAIGKEINNYINVVTEDAVQKADLIDFLGYKVLASNFSSKRFHSQIGNALVMKKPPMGVVWWIGDGGLHVSLRSSGKFDVSKIAQHFPDGGGHRNAAGFTIPFKGKFPWKVLKQNEK